MTISNYLLGMGTARPEHVMTQGQAIEMAQQVTCRTEEDRRLLAAIYRRAGIDTRSTCLPHEIAYRWHAEELARLQSGEHAPFPEEDETADSSPPQKLAAASASPIPSAVTQDDLPVVHGPTTAERMAIYHEAAGPLAIAAARKALEQAEVAGHQVTHLITVSCTGFRAPGVDIALIGELELQPTTERLQIGFMGCHGVINGLRAAQAILASQPRACVLLCAVELCSLHYHFPWDPECLVGNALFADGAAAVVLGGAEFPAASPQAPWQLQATGSYLIPGSQDAMRWEVGDHGFEMSLSPLVPGLIEEHLASWLQPWLAGHSLGIEDVGSWAVHPGGTRVLSAVEDGLGLPAEATTFSRQILRECGNMSSPTVLFIFERLQRSSQRAKPCVMLGFGPGLVAEVALWR